MAEREMKVEVGGEEEAEVLSHEEALDRISYVRRERSPYLDLSGFDLDEIPSEVFGFRWLKELDLSDIGLDVLPDEIVNLRNLERLDLWNNDDLEVPEGIGYLSSLRELAIGKNCELPISIGDCTKLEVLAIGSNGLHELPEWLTSLRALKELQLWSNELDELPDWWDFLRNLKVVNLSDNNLTSLPPSFVSLPELQILDLNRNLLTDLPQQPNTFPKLKQVFLSNNNFKNVPEAVSQWENLELLDLCQGQRLYYDSEERGLANLMFVESSPRIPGASLETLSPNLRNLTSLKFLMLHGNKKLQLPRELLGSVALGNSWDGSVEGILEYYFRTRRGARPLNEAKLIILGWGGVGKTSLVNRLVHQRFDSAETRTEGIEVTSWPVDLANGDHVRLNIWDFGGQEIMHATHQFFLTSRSVYLVVLNGRAGSADTDADYWLKIVSSFAPDSPIIIALNQIAKDPFDLDETSLRQNFPNIYAFVRTDCAVGDDGFGIDQLVEAIHAVTDSLEDLRVNFPSAWFEIKDRLAGMGENYLTFERYREICSEFQEFDRQAQDQLADYLNSLGIALNYREDPRLRDTHVLNPHWVTEGIYAILNSQLTAERHGEIAVSDLAYILDFKRYPVERHTFILDLMRRFELCFLYADESDRYLVADLLPKKQPAEASDFEVEGSLRFEYRYPILPEGLLPRFIVRTHVHSMGQPRWRNGALLSWENNTALVQSDSASRVVRIAVSGPADGRRRLLAVIRSDFEHIHGTYSFKVGSYVPVREGLAVEYEKLIAAERAGMDTFPEFVDNDFVEVNVRNLLAGVDLRTGGRQAATGVLSSDRYHAVKMFISYSHRDDRYRDTLESHLKVLGRAGALGIWHDRRLAPGDDWKGRIDDALEEADLVVFLVSADFLASDYCNDVELRRALERQAEGTCRIIPIIVRDSLWQASSLASFQALPTDGKAITTWTNEDTAWRNVAEGLERVISRLRRRSSAE